MSWVRLHDGAMTHPKVVGLSDKAFRAWIWGLSYAQQHLTDGWLPDAAIPARLKRAAPELTAVVLWERGDVGFHIHDYLDWNDSRDDVLKKRTEAKERMSNARQRSSRELLRRVGLGRSGVDLEKENVKDGFAEFWAAYPRKVGKDAALKAWEKRQPDDELVTKMLDALAWQSQSPDWRKDGGQFIPHPATWLNQARWEDEPVTNLAPMEPPANKRVAGLIAGGQAFLNRGRE